jgi:hypothetical protein
MGADSPIKRVIGRPSGPFCWIKTNIQLNPDKQNEHVLLIRDGDSVAATSHFVHNRRSTCTWAVEASAQIDYTPVRVLRKNRGYT